MSTYVSAFMRAAGRLLDLGNTTAMRGTRDPHERAVRALRGAWLDTVTPLQKEVEGYIAACKAMPHVAQSSNTRDEWLSLADTFERQGMAHEANLARLRATKYPRLFVDSTMARRRSRLPRKTHTNRV